MLQKSEKNEMVIDKLAFSEFTCINLQIKSINILNDLEETERIRAYISEQYRNLTMLLQEYKNR
jgi:hypothetical protein